MLAGAWRRVYEDSINSLAELWLVRTKRSMTRISRKSAFGLLVVCTGLCVLAETSNGQNALYQWATQGGGIGSDRNGGILVDSSSNIFVVGNFQYPDQARVITFGALTYTGDALDVFLAKLDLAGNVLWVQQGDGANNSDGDDVASDGQGNLAITGNYHNGIRFGSYAFGHVGGPNGFVAKYDSGGGLAWAADLDAGSLGTSVAMDTDGSVYVGGRFGASNITVGPITLNRNGASGGNGFILKFSPGGVPLWGYAIGNTDGSVDDVSISGDGGCYIVGNFSGTATLGSQTLALGASAALFMAKLGADGNWQWAKRPWLNSARGGSARINVDSVGNILLAGAYEIPLDFGVTNLPFASGANCFLAKYSPAGSAVWAVACRATSFSTSSLQPEGLTTDSQDNPLLTATFTGTVTFGPSTFTTGSRDGMVAKCSASGSPLWARRCGITSSSITRDLAGAFDASGNCYLAGTFDRPGTIGGITLTNGSSGDVFVVQFRTPPGLLSQPSNVAAPLGGTATFNVVADGNGPLSIQWQLNGTNLPGNTNASLIISNVQAFKAGAYTVIVSNPAGTVTSAPATLTISTVLVIAVQGEGTVSKSPNRSFYNLGELVTLTASPGRWHAFTRWGDGPTVNPRVITIGISNSYTAIFSPTTAVETLTFDNVSRTAPVGMPAVFVDGEFIIANSVTRTGAVEVAMLTTFPNGVVLYTLDGSEPSLFSRIYEGPFLLGRPAIIRALAFDAFFAQSWEADAVEVIVIPEYGLNVSTSGGGTVGWSPAGGPFASDTVVSLTATPSVGWSFLQWLGDATGTSAGAAVVMNRERCVEAVFGTTFSNVVSGAGAVVVEPAAALYPHGSTVRLTAVPQAGHGFALWGGAAGGTNNPLVFTVTNGAPVVSAAFAALSAGQVALSVVPSGGGRVTASPRANRYASGSGVTLTALPDAGQDFTGWGGDAGGTANPLTVTLNTSKVIAANFTKRPMLKVFTCAGPPEPGVVPLLLSGEPGGAYVIEASADLQQWSTLVTVTNRFGTVQWNDASVEAQRFYRARSAP